MTIQRQYETVWGIAITIAFFTFVGFFIYYWDVSTSNVTRAFTEEGSYIWVFRSSIFLIYFVLPILGGTAFLFTIGLLAIAGFHVVRAAIHLIIVVGLALAGAAVIMFKAVVVLNNACLWFFRLFDAEERRKHKQQQESKRKKSHDQSRQSNNARNDFDPSRFKNSAPRGWDKRNPQDVNLWAMVDDPSASEGERKNALSAILRKEAKRKNNGGVDLTASAS